VCLSERARSGQPLSSDLEERSGLSPVWDIELRIAIERRYTYLRPEHRLHRIDSGFDVNVAVLPLVHGVRPYVDDDVEVSRRGAALSRFSLSPQTQGVAIFDAGRDDDPELPLPPNPPVGP